MQTSRIQTIAFAVLLGGAVAGLWGYATSVAAAEAEPEDEDAVTETANEEESGDSPSSEVFIPTEEISEDFAVSFPVDI